MLYILAVGISNYSESSYCVSLAKYKSICVSSVQPHGPIPASKLLAIILAPLQDLIPTLVA